MITRIHKIHWPARFSKSGEDIDFLITDVDACVTDVTNPIAAWAIGQWWFRVSMWFEKKGCRVTLGEAEEV